MDHYQVIARKYRPQRFCEVVGQNPIVRTLLHALKMNRVAHAYLFSGLRGTGKTTLARILAKALNCHAPTEEGEPCNRCSSCQEIASGRSLDVIEIDGASNRGIDDIRELNESVGYSPSSGKFKIYIIDEVHMLTKEAFNALLKTLEEPPPKVKFFFATTEPHKVLPTILSRCQRFDLARISESDIVHTLQNIASDMNSVVEEEALTLIARLSEGSMRDAESLLDQVLLATEPPITERSIEELLGLPSKEPLFRLDSAILSHDLPQAFELSEELYNSGIDLTYFLEALAEHFRVLLVMKMGGHEATLSTTFEERYRKSAGHFTQEHLLYILDYLVKWQTQVQKRPLKRFEIEVILLHLIRSKNRISVDGLFRRLTELEHRLNGHAPQVEEPKEIPQNAAPTPPLQAINKEPPQEVTPSPLKELPKAKASAEPPQELFTPPTRELPKEKASTEAPQKPISPATGGPKSPIPTDEAHARYETLMRFASVELNGSIKSQ